MCNKAPGRLISAMVSRIGKNDNPAIEVLWVSAGVAGGGVANISGLVLSDNGPILPVWAFGCERLRNNALFAACCGVCACVCVCAAG